MVVGVSVELEDSVVDSVVGVVISSVVVASVVVIGSVEDSSGVVVSVVWAIQY